MEVSGLFESEADDYVARASAAMVHRQISWWLFNNEEHLASRTVPAIDNGGFILFSEQFDMDEDYPDLVIAFLPQNKEAVATGYGSKAGFTIAKDDSPVLRGKKVIILRCLLAPNDYTHVVDRFRVGFKASFIHEFQHYLLSSRRTGGRTSSEAMEQDGIVGYFNDNDETNAYYIEATHDIADFFNATREKYPQKLQRFSDMTTPELIEWAKKEFFFSGFIKHASPPTMRALNKRLYRFFEQSMRPMIDRVLANYS